jgi:hypothetical protein
MMIYNPLNVINHLSPPNILNKIMNYMIYNYVLYHTNT